jgi:hypothetical protein
MPKRCETCKYYDATPNHALDKIQFDGYCTRYPEWRPVDDNHYCGEWKEDVKG